MRDEDGAPTYAQTRAASGRVDVRRWYITDPSTGVLRRVFDDIGHLQTQAHAPALIAPGAGGDEFARRRRLFVQVLFEERCGHDTNRAGHVMAIAVEFVQVAAVEADVSARPHRRHGT